MLLYQNVGLTEGKVASRSGSGTVIAAPGAGKTIIVHDVVMTGAANLTAGSVVVIYGTGAECVMNFSAGVPFGENKAVVLSAAVNTTVTYSIVDHKR